MGTPSSDQYLRRAEFDNAIREYGAEAASTYKLALTGTSEEYSGASRAKMRAVVRVSNAWAAMVAAGDPETKH